MKSRQTKKAKKPGRPPRYGPELEKLNGSVPVTPEKLARSLWSPQPDKDQHTQKRAT